MLIACEKLNRICYSMEIDCHYMDVIVKRFVDYVGSDENVFVERDNKKITYADLSETFMSLKKDRLRGREYYGENIEEQKSKARLRDGKCQKCGAIKSANGNELDVHHIIPFSVFGIENYEKANDLSNLICYCHDCHNSIEPKKRDKKRAV